MHLHTHFSLRGVALRQMSARRLPQHAVSTEDSTTFRFSSSAQLGGTSLLHTITAAYYRAFAINSHLPR